MLTRECEQCGKKFPAKPYLIKKNWARFCSRRCHYKSRKLYRICEYCGNKFHVQKSRVEQNHHRFCSVSCRSFGTRVRRLVACDQCRKQFLRKPSAINHKNFCSHQCHMDYITKNYWHCAVCGMGLLEAIDKYATNRDYRDKRVSGKLKTCSRSCANKYMRKGKYLNCAVCNKEIYRHQKDLRQRNYCSRECMYQWRRTH